MVSGKGFQVHVDDTEFPEKDWKVVGNAAVRLGLMPTSQK